MSSIANLYPFIKSIYTINLLIVNGTNGDNVGNTSDDFGILVPDGKAFSIWGVIFTNLLVFSFIIPPLSIFRVKEPWYKEYEKSCLYCANWVKKFSKVPLNINDYSTNKERTDKRIEAISKLNECRYYIILLKYKLYQIIMEIVNESFIFCSVKRAYLKTFQTYFTWLNGACYLNQKLVYNATIDMYKNFIDDSNYQENTEINLEDWKNKLVDLGFNVSDAENVFEELKNTNNKINISDMNSDYIKKKKI